MDRIVFKPVFVDQLGHWDYMVMNMTGIRNTRQFNIDSDLDLVEKE
ncbi:hypothetical protein KJ762_07095 [bacterium]|nr:hypothetical protein [bacterium]MBU1064489.1 hypothetical protein [bacterium]MBU1634260.1 hypothetical protein [bacterium]MBU1872159.1 hypothetical protein [bacterium]